MFYLYLLVNIKAMHVWMSLLYVCEFQLCNCMYRQNNIKDIFISDIPCLVALCFEVS